MSLKRLAFGTLVLFLSEAFGNLPDPDLFDGIVYGTEASSSSIEARASGGSGGGTSNTSGSQTVARDVDQITIISAVEGVPVQSSKRGGSEVEGIDDASTPSGIGQATTVSSAGETIIDVEVSGTPRRERDLDEFEFGVVDEALPMLETNSSKEPLEPPSVVRAKPSEGSNSQYSSQDESAKSGDQDPYNGNSHGDYGTDVPSGL